jgi:hypothetical protein
LERRSKSEKRGGSTILETGAGKTQGGEGEDDYYRKKNSGTKRCMLRRRVSLSWEFRSEGYTSKEETITGVANH